jgi:hypothetical protein
MIRKALLSIVCAVALIVASASPGTSTPAANQVLRGVDIQTLVTNGALTTSAPCPSPTGLNVLTRAQIVGCVRNNGSCASGASASYYIPVWQDLINCRTLTGQVSTSVSGTADGPAPCNLLCQQGGGSASPASPLDTSTSSTTVNPSGSFPISWSVTPSSVVGTCTLVLKYAGSAVNGAVGLSAGTTVTGSYTTSGGAGVYTLHIACSSNNSSATVSGTLSWYQ